MYSFGLHQLPLSNVTCCCCCCEMLSSWKLVQRKRKGWDIVILAVIIALTLLFLLYATRIPATTLSHKFTFRKELPSEFKPSTPVTLALALCNNDGPSRPSPKSTVGKWHLMAKGLQRQINQTVVLLKSIVIQDAIFGATNFVPVEVLVLSDDFHNFVMLEAAIEKEKWATELLGRIQLTFVPAAYPSGTEWMRNLFRPCSTLRLFLDDLLTNYDSVIYIDTDFIFCRPISDLWSEFDHFTSKNLAALAPSLAHYGSPQNSVPFYGETGLNAGLMLMNLTRSRRANWTQSVRQIVEQYSNQIILADQDILNIYFNTTPSNLHQLSCDWNFQLCQCRRGHFCLDRELGAGISALHGNTLSFMELGSEPIFRAVFSTFQTFNLSSISHLMGFTRSLREAIMRVQQNETYNSNCTLYGAFPVLLLNRMELRVRESNNNKVMT